MSSFTMMIKEEIAQKDFKNCCQRALLAAFIKNNNNTLVTNSNITLKISSSQNKTFKLIYQLLKKQFPEKTLKLTIAKDKIRHRFTLSIISSNTNVIEEFFLHEDNLYFTKNIACKDCIRAYITGAFLAGGSINSPQTPNYHLEIQFIVKNMAIFVQSALIKYFSLNFKIIQRRKKYMIYIKKANDISDFLKVIDCPEAVFKFEDKRITRDLLNTINRFNNIDISNQQKILDAGIEQVRMISTIIKEDYFNELSKKCQILAKIRIKNQDASLNELGTIFYQETGEKISKSGVNHLIIEIKKKFQELMLNKNKERGFNEQFIR